MAPIKFEDNIREKLEERELQPSSNAWKKLQTQLPEEEKESKSYLWFAIAASFIGIVIVGSFLFNSNNSATKDNDIVVEETQNEVETQTPINNAEVFKQPEIENEIQNKSTRTEVASEEVQKIIAPKKVGVQQEIIPRTTQNKVIQTTTDAVAQVSNKEQEIQKQSTIEIEDELIKKDKIINSKINEVVAQVQALEKNNPDITAKEIDALLARAQREIATQRILNSTTIDAAALLDDVESDLEQSFRDKVFDALGDGYSKIRTAVVERNN